MAPERKRSSSHLLRFAALLASLLAFSCSLFGKKPAVLWTDTPEILIAVEMFNASQNRHLIEVHYVGELAQALRRPLSGGETAPSIVIGKGLRTQALGGYFQSLEYLFGELVLSRDSFYPALLDGGIVGGRQTLVPVSFNLMLVASGKESTWQDGAAGLDPPVAAGGAIAMDEIRRRAALFNGKTEKGEERMGFSPRWPDEDFLFQWIQLGGADFREGGARTDAGLGGAQSLLSWDRAGLEGAVASLRDYIRAVNGSVAAEDAFSFKYLFAPGYKNVETGRVLFAAMNSADYFTLPPVTRSKYDYRYFSEGEKLAIAEDIKYAGIPRRAPNKESSEQFLRWFFVPEHQKEILEKSRSLRLSESAFGVAGGFSSIQSVTETLFPSYYTDLLGRTPPGAMIAPPEPFPPSWEGIKTELILPWLDEAAAGDQGSPAAEEFSSRLNTYLDRNPDLR